MGPTSQAAHITPAKDINAVDHRPVHHLENLALDLGALKDLVDQYDNRPMPPPPKINISTMNNNGVGITNLALNLGALKDLADKYMN